ncbi:hypothetical protein [Parabacteroides gordonii]|uniref:hypothetical protein n=1 Tax=Parabacteroides gordonii TaxID=574930 RepID=UPI00241FFBE9|nr:hypothetical protein [Parabacteroides gordonii]
MAAIISIPLLILTLTFGYLFFERNATDIERRIKFMEVTSAPGMVTRLELPDNSKVCLNTGSTLRYPPLFAGNTREVEFTNETIYQIFSYLEEATPIRWKVNTMKQNNDSTFAKQQINVWLK